MNELRPRRVHLLELLPLLFAVAWGIVTWQDIHSQISAMTGWARLLLGGAMWLLGLGGIAWGAREWKRLGLRASVPAVLVGLGLASNPIVVRIASADADARFLARRADYQALVESVVSGQRSAASITRDSLPATLADCCLRMEVSVDSAFGGQGIFITQWTFGPKDAGWLYVQRGTVGASMDLLGKRFTVRPVADHWYRIDEGPDHPEGKE